MDAVGAAHLEGHAVLFGAGDDGGERAVDPLEEEHAGVADLQCERGVDDVRGSAQNRMRHRARTDGRVQWLT